MLDALSRDRVLNTETCRGDGSTTSAPWSVSIPAGRGFPAKGGVASDDNKPSLTASNRLRTREKLLRANLTPAFDLESTSRGA